MRGGWGVLCVAVLLIASGCAQRAPESPPPQLVALLSHSAPANDVSGASFCAGVRVSERTVLTAQHCLRDHDDPIDTITSAANLCSTATIPGERLAVTGSRAVPGAVDGAAMTTATSDGPRPLKRGPRPQVGQVLTAWGWGAHSPGGQKPCAPEPKRVVVVDSGRCAALFSPEPTLPAFCAVGTDQRNTCTGDSGGPVLDERGRLVGIVSAGRGCDQDAVGSYWFVGR